MSVMNMLGRFIARVLTKYAQKSTDYTLFHKLECGFEKDSLLNEFFEYLNLNPSCDLPAQ